MQKGWVTAEGAIQLFAKSRNAKTKSVIRPGFVQRFFVCVRQGILESLDPGLLPLHHLACMNQGVGDMS